MDDIWGHGVRYAENGEKPISSFAPGSDSSQRGIDRRGELRVGEASVERAHGRSGKGPQATPEMQKL